MTALLAHQLYSGVTQQPLIINSESSTAVNLGGNLQRETTFGTFAIHRRTSRSAQTAGKVFTVANSNSLLRVYEFFPNARNLLLSADPSGGSTLPVKGDTITGDVSGATGVLLEDYIAGDDFIIYEPTNGTDFQAEAVTINGGSSGTNTATVTAFQDRSGEHGVVFSTSCNGSVSGLHHGRTPSNDVTLHCLFRNGTTFEKIVYDAVGNQWVQSTIETGVNTNVGQNGRAGHAIIDQNTIYWYLWAFTGSNPDYLFVHNTITGATVFTTMPGSTFLSAGPSFVAWRGGVYCTIVDTAGSDPSTLVEVTGGSPVVLFSFDDLNHGEQIPCFVSEDDNALYILGRSTAGFAELVRFVKQTNGTIVRTCGGTNAAALNESIASAMLPAAIVSDPRPDTFIRLRDVEDTPGEIKTRIYTAATNGGVLTEYLYNKAAQIDSGLPATFNGTTTIVFQNDVSGVLAPDDWIIVWNDDDKFAYRVDSVATNTVTVTNLGDVNNAIPTGDFEVRKSQILSTFGTNPSSIGCTFGEGEMFGGGYVFTTGEIEAQPLSRSAVVGGTRQTFKLFDPNNNGFTDRVAEIYFLNTRTLETGRATIGNASGPVVSNQATGLTADGVTEEFIDWDAETDGQEIGEPTDLVIRILT